MDLDTARGMIDAADWKMRDSFCARMEGSAAVAAAKSASGDAVYQPGREDQILADRMQGIPAEFRDAYRGFLSGVMRISREYQYRKRLQADLALPFPLSENPKTAETVDLTGGEETDILVMLSFLCAQRKQYLAGFSGGCAVLSWAIRKSARRQTVLALCWGREIPAQAAVAAADFQIPIVLVVPAGRGSLLIGFQAVTESANTQAFLTMLVSEIPGFVLTGALLPEEESRQPADGVSDQRPDGAAQE